MKRVTHSFEELSKVGERYYGDKGFCGVIALAAAAQVSFGKARAVLMRHDLPETGITVAPKDGFRTFTVMPEKRRHRKGTNIARLSHAAESLGCFSSQISAPAKTLGACARRLPRNGVFWIWSTSHITCVVDGKMIDWADTSRRHHVVAVFEVIRNF